METTQQYTEFQWEREKADKQKNAEGYEGYMNIG